MIDFIYGLISLEILVLVLVFLVGYIFVTQGPPVKAEQFNRPDLGTIIRGSGGLRKVRWK